MNLVYIREPTTSIASRHRQSLLDLKLFSTYKGGLAWKKNPGNLGPVNLSPNDFRNLCTAWTKGARLTIEPGLLGQLQAGSFKHMAMALSILLLCEVRSLGKGGPRASYDITCQSY
jgi:hypothetical protein